MVVMSVKKPEFMGDEEGLFELVFGTLDGTTYLRMRHLLDDIKKGLSKGGMLLLLLQIPLLSA